MILPEILGSIQIDVAVDGVGTGKCTLVLTGYLHAHSLSVNQLVNVFCFFSKKTDFLSFGE